MKPRFLAAFGAVAALLTLAASAQGPQAPNPAMNAPDETAWQLFMIVAAPAANGAATFETWASDSDTFVPNPKFPAGPTLLSLHAPIVPSVGRQLLQKNGKVLPALPPGIAQGVTEETRRNQAAFTFIVQNGLFSRSGLAKAFGRDLSFPTDSIEVKANWIPVESVPTFTLNRVALTDASKYFHLSKDASTGRLYALVSVHVISKLVPNWTWATFENRFNPGRCDFLGCRDSFGAVTSHVAPNAGRETGYGDCQKTPALAAMMASARLAPVFVNYCLKGSQVDFTNNTGMATRLGDSVTERTFIESSCMSCHSRSSWDANGRDASPGGAGFNADGSAPLGPVDPTIYWSFSGTPFEGMPGATRKATSGDFVWSLAFCAYEDKVPGNPSGCTGK
jgi:hypothetical protein